MKIQFVYNANSGFGNLLLDVAHKMISPKTYACNLCAITHNNFGRKEDFSEFVDSLPVPIEFLHKDEFEKQTGRKENYPVVLFLGKDGFPIQKISADEINSLQAFEDLKIKINDILKTPELVSQPT